MLGILDIKSLSDYELRYLRENLAKEVCERSRIGERRVDAGRPGTFSALDFTKAFHGDLIAILAAVFAAINISGGMEQEAKTAVAIREELDYLDGKDIARGSARGCDDPDSEIPF